MGRTTNLEAFAIFNVGSPTRYIKRSWLTRTEVEKELASLLWPYPPKHEWRKKLEVRACLLTPADAARIEREQERTGGHAVTDHRHQAKARMDRRVA